MEIKIEVLVIDAPQTRGTIDYLEIKAELDAAIQDVIFKNITLLQAPELKINFII